MMMIGLWLLPTILLNCGYDAAANSRNSNPHAPLTITWEVLDEANSPVFSLSKLVPPWTWWPDLTPDLCHLAMGSPNWDLPHHSDLTRPPDEKQCTVGGIGGGNIGCSGQFYRANLRETELYVCPGQGQSRYLQAKCGGSGDFFLCLLGV